MDCCFVLNGLFGSINRHLRKPEVKYEVDIIEVTNLNKLFGDLKAVNDVTFQIKQGEIFGFLGPNGAGKTSTINMMTGLSRPSSGSITIDGIDAVRDIKKAQSIMGVVPDENNLYDDMDWL